MKQIIMLAGYKRSGKDTFAGMLKKLDPSIKIVSFAAPMKDILATTFDIPMTVLEDYKNAGYALQHGVSEANSYESPATSLTKFLFSLFDDKLTDNSEYQSYRNVLQRFGSEGMKKWFGDDVWARLAAEQIERYFQFTDTVVISDFRFEEEYEYLLEHFSEAKDGQVKELTINLYTVRIDRIDARAFDQHISERALDDFDFEVTVANDSTLEALKEQAEIFLQYVKENNEQVV